MAMTQRTRPISWIKAALREFETFPEEARSIFLVALTIAAEGGKADIAKPMHGIGSGVLEIACPTARTPSVWSTPYKSARTSGCSMRFRRKQLRAFGRHNVKLT